MKYEINETMENSGRDLGTAVDINRQLKMMMMIFCIYVVKYIFLHYH